MRVIVEDGTERVVIEGGKPAGAQNAQWEGGGVAGRLVKSEPARRFTLVVAYPANRPDQQVAADGFRDFASPEALEEAAWSYLTKSPHVGLWHENGTDGAGTVCESYIYRGPEWHIQAVDGSEQIVKAGDWMLGIQWSEETWPLVLKGHIRGVSMQGSASRRKPSPESLSQLRRR